MIQTVLREEMEKILTPDQILYNEPMDRHCSFRTGGPADALVKVKTEKEMAALLQLLRNCGEPCFLLGKGTNLLIGDGGYRGVIVTAAAEPAENLPEGKEEDSPEGVDDFPLDGIRVDGCSITAGAGATLKAAALAALKHGLTGLEFAAGIPGTVGGGLVMNAGAYGGEIRLVTGTVRLLMPDGSVREYSPEQMEFGYRTSILRRVDAAALRARFDLTPGDPEKILLQTRNLGKTFPDGKVLFRDVNFEIKACDKMFLVGPNGCGKTTMLSLLLGKISEFDGDVLISGSSRIGYMGQFVPFEDETRTILDELMERSELGETAARNLLARFGFRDIDVYKQISVLSGGERSRLFLCCLLEEKPELLFLDEPTNHLDIESREVLEDALADYNGAILAVSHDRYFIEKCQSKILGFFGDHVELYDKYEFYRRK